MQTTMNISDIAKMIDLSAVQAENDEHYINKLIETAKEYNCIAVFALPSWINFLKKSLGSNTNIMMGGAVGFPSGGNTTKIKVSETNELISLGCSEIDMVINIGKIKSGFFQDVYQDIHAVVNAAGEVPVKVILECHHLSSKEILMGCDMAIKAGGAWVKTGTGWPTTGATTENIKLIHNHVGSQIKIKASGGIRDLETLLVLHKLGATRFGIGLNSALVIFQELIKTGLMNTLTVNSGS